MSFAVSPLRRHCACGAETGEQRSEIAVMFLREVTKISFASSDARKELTEIGINVQQLREIAIQVQFFPGELQAMRQGGQPSGQIAGSESQLVLDEIQGARKDVQLMGFAVVAAESTLNLSMCLPQDVRRRSAQVGEAA